MKKYKFMEMEKYKSFKLKQKKNNNKYFENTFQSKNKN